MSELSDAWANQVAADVLRQRRPGDVVVASVHWGDNWGYHIPAAQRHFAHRLIDAGAVDVVHGHSSHHVKGIEVYGGRLVLYGCGDFVTDYEGISGRENYRPELVLAYFATLEAASGRLVRLEMVPFRSRRLRLERVAAADALWLRDVLHREGKALGTAAELTAGGTLLLRW